MRFTGLFVLFAAAASAQPLVIERDLGTVTDVLSNVQTDIDGLDTALKGLTTDVAPVLQASKKLVATIGDSTTAIQASGSLGLFDAVGLLEPVDELMQHAQALVLDLMGKKDTVQKNGFCQDVTSQINNIDDKGNGLINVIVSKIPGVFQDIAKELAQGFTDILNDAQAAFSGGNCVNA